VYGSQSAAIGGVSQVTQPPEEGGPEVSEAPEAPEASEAPEAPEVSEAPEAPEASEAPEAPEVSEGPEAPEVSEGPEGEVPEAPAALALHHDEQAKHGSYTHHTQEDQTHEDTQEHQTHENTQEDQTHEDTHETPDNSPETVESSDDRRVK
jgi:pyochelin synthetase